MALHSDDNGVVGEAFIKDFFMNTPFLKGYEISQVITNRRNTYLCRGTLNNVPTALKIQRIADDADNQVASEIAILLKYPELCPEYLLFHGDGGDSTWALLRWINGISARERGIQLRAESVQDRRVYRALCLRLLKALDHAHEQGVLHGDLQPAHFIEEKGSYTLIDWGLAMSVKEGKYKGGMSHFMAPEIAQQLLSKDMAEYSMAAEIYSMAAVLHVILTGYPPIMYGPKDYEESKETKLSAIAGYKRRKILVKSDLDLYKAIERGLDKDPACRYQSIDDFVKFVSHNLTLHT